jgi:hypothetical protein
MFWNASFQNLAYVHQDNIDLGCSCRVLERLEV